ncbi:MAG: tetratricopeptide repeat protein [Bdellovibrionales bacterium]|nr:tetratricopeptide repeat protein [Bdellovibrionales bacterium]
MSEILNKLAQLQDRAATKKTDEPRRPKSSLKNPSERYSKLLSRLRVFLISSLVGGATLIFCAVLLPHLFAKRSPPPPTQPLVTSSDDTRNPASETTVTTKKTTDDDLIHKAEELVRTGKMDQAMTLLERETGGNPFLIRSLFQLAKLYQKKNRPDRATATLMRILQIEPKNPLAYNNLGVIQLRQKRYKEAIYFLSKACEFAPSAPDPLLNLAITYEQAMQLTESVQTYRRYSELMSSEEARTQRTASERRTLAAVKNRILRLHAFSISGEKSPMGESQP